MRGLIDIGVRAGEHVGVLMHTRPTALALVAAVNRLGAVAVLLRGDADLADAIFVGGVEHLVSDPDHAADAAAVWHKTLYVLGGVHASGRTLPDGAVDMERIDPARVAVTPDGPRGPRERVQPGAVAAAQHAGVPIVAVGARTASAWYLNSWDRMCIPKPFARIDVEYAAPIHIAAGKAGLRAGIAAVERALHEVTRT